jgi:hypothetical protein
VPDPGLRIEVHAIATDPRGGAVVLLRINGKQVAQLEQLAPTAVEAMTSALAGAILAIGREEERRGR